MAACTIHDTFTSWLLSDVWPDEAPNDDPTQVAMYDNNNLMLMHRCRCSRPAQTCAFSRCKWIFCVNA